MARDGSAETQDRLQEVVQVLQSQGLLSTALSDALAWLPLHQGRLADPLRSQASMDARIATGAHVRNLIALHMRDQFAARTANAAPPDALPLDDANALSLALAVPQD